MAFTYPKPSGFPLWEERGNDPSIILSAALTSSSTLGGGVPTGAGAGSITYNQNGVLLSATASINFVSLLSAAQLTSLLSGFTMTCWIESGWIDSGYVGTVAGEHLMGANGGGSNYWTAVKGNGGTVMQGRSGGTLSNNATDTTVTSATNKASSVRVDMVYYGGGNTLYYIDFLPSTILNKGPPTTTPFASFLGVGGSTTGVAPVAHRIMNFMLRSIPSVPAIFQKVSHIAMFGHSFAARGDYGASGSAYIVGDVVGTGATEDRCLGTIHRQLVSHGIQIPTGKIRNYGVSGTTVSQLSTQITSAIASGQNLKVALIQSGVNEVTSSTNSFATDYPTWTTTWQTQINSLIAAGANLILIGNVVSPVNDVVDGFNVTIYKTRTNDANALIDTVIASNPTTCVKVDLFNTFGGHNINSADFLSNNIHPSDQGHYKIGLAFANALLAHL